VVQKPRREGEAPEMSSRQCEPCDTIRARGPASAKRLVACFPVPSFLQLH